MPPTTYSYQTTSGTSATTTDQSNAPGIDPHSGFQVVPPTTVSSATTAPTSTTNYSQPNYPPAPDITKLSTDYTPVTATPQETQESALTSRLQDINDQLAGKSAYQTQQNTAAGVDSITQAINDNNTAVKQLQNDSAAAKLQTDNRLAPTFAIAGEQGAIDRSTAVKALTLSSISDVLQNNLVAAQHKADAAVQAQFGPLEAELAAKTANLKLIQNDPATSLADKNRAAAQQLVLNKQTADIAQARQDAADVQKLAISAAQQAKTFTPTSQYPTLATALQAIATAQDPVAATAIATASGLATPGKVNTSIQNIGGRAVQIVTDDQGNIVKRTDLGSSATYSELHPSSSAGTEGTDLDFARNYLTNNPGTDPNKAKQDFLARHPSAGAAWDNYWGITASNPGGNFPQAAPNKSGLFGLGFLGL